MSRVYRVREFAAVAGVTVKALHHYDRLGLLKPNRTDAGYRLYARRDVERVHRIVALKFLGLTLKEIKVVLDGGATSLAETLHARREVLREKLGLLDRAIGAIEDTERNRQFSAASPARALSRLIEVIGMTDDIDVMKRYYSEQAWAKWRHYYEVWPSRDWQMLFADVEAALVEDPASEMAQSLAARWLALEQADTGGDPAIQAGLWRAWIDRQRWPEALRQKIAEFHLEAIRKFIAEAIWIRAETERRRRSGTAFRAPDRVSPSRRALAHELEAALRGNPGGEEALTLVRRWEVLLENEAGGDPELKSAMMKAWSGRRDWPTGFRSYVASLYEMSPEAFEGVANFIEEARGGAR